MSRNIPQKRSTGPIGGKTELQAKLWPNGEIAIWKARSFKMDPMPSPQNEDLTEFKMSAYRLYQESRLLLQALACPLGLSLLPIFDKLKRDIIEGVQRVTKPRAAKGSTGITSYGKRMVRNSAYLLEQLGGKARCIFATCTVPPLPVEQMRILHEGWGKVVEYYRLGIRRALQKQGLSGETVTVTEIQEKRYEKTGLPVSHIHSVFIGVTTIGRYAISTEDHDRIWHLALSSVIDIERDECATACNLQRVKKSASGYMAKYLTKGSVAVKAAMDDGFAGWLPKHWWNCSRSLMRRVKSQTRDISPLADWLNSVADIDGQNVWKWHRDVVLDMGNGHLVTIARYGQLSNRQMAEVQAYYAD